MCCHVDHTCGPCDKGYSGTDGASNSKCWEDEIFAELEIELMLVVLVVVAAQTRPSAHGASGLYTCDIGWTGPHCIYTTKEISVVTLFS
jgi:hypothetical protein